MLAGEDVQVRSLGHDEVAGFIEAWNATHESLSEPDSARLLPLGHRVGLVAAARRMLQGNYHDRAMAIMEALPRRSDGNVFGSHPNSVTRGFAKACKRAGIKGLCLHDIRHEATSRLFEKGLNQMQVASITGHQSLQMLKRYTHLKAEDLVEMLG